MVKLGPNPNKGLLGYIKCHLLVSVCFFHLRTVADKDGLVSGLAYHEGWGGQNHNEALGVNKTLTPLDHSKS